MTLPQSTVLITQQGKQTSLQLQPLVLTAVKSDCGVIEPILAHLCCSNDNIASPPMYIANLTFLKFDYRYLVKGHRTHPQWTGCNNSFNSSVCGGGFVLQYKFIIAIIV